MNSIGQPIIQEFAILLGEEFADFSASSQDKYAQGTEPYSTRVLGVVYPHTVLELQGILAIARKYKIPLYPVSKGRNFGYGSTSPHTDSQIIVDLGRMNRILEVNKELAYVCVEPGVTQKQLHDYLEINAPELWADATGAGLEASIIGNILERGFGHTTVGDHTANCAALEVLLGNGELIRTGLSHFNNAHAKDVYKYGVGPSLDGLFSQSNFGIVTRATVWLQPRPEKFKAFFALSLKSRDSIGDLIDRLRPLRLSGAVRNAIHIANDIRCFSSRVPYPYERTDGATRMSEEVRSDLRNNLKIGHWNISGGIYGSSSMVKVVEGDVRKILSSCKLIFIDDKRMAILLKLSSVLRKFKLVPAYAEVIDLLHHAYNLLKGIPSDDFFQGVNWICDIKSDEVLHPDTGLLWVSPVLPATGYHARKVLEILETTFELHGFDCPVTLTFVTERVLCCISNISFRKSMPDEVERAEACYEDSIRRLMDAGYPPYRLSPGGQKVLHEYESNFWDISMDLKKVLDPDSIISPGRYIPISDDPESDFPDEEITLRKGSSQLIN